ncbi:MAG: DUF6011 domain-containing protein [Thermomicrobiales bacterium]
MNDERPHPGKGWGAHEITIQGQFTMALSLLELPTNGYIRRTPPTFIPLEDPSAKPMLRLVMRRQPSAGEPADERIPCRCRRCHRLLRSAASIAAGIGPACARKEGSSVTATPLFDGLEVA